MTAEDRVATVRAMFEELERPGSALTFSVFDDEVTWDARALPTLDSARVFHGHDGVRSFWRAWLEAWETIGGLFVEGPRYCASGNQVVAWWVSRLTGKGSGVPVRQEAASIFTFLGDRIVHVAIYLSHADAFRDIGMERTP